MSALATLGDAFGRDAADRIAAKIDAERSRRPPVEVEAAPIVLGYPVAHITVHGDMFCMSCKQPEKHADGHDWLPVYEGETRSDACDECGSTVGGEA